MFGISFGKSKSKTKIDPFLEGASKSAITGLQQFQGQQVAPYAQQRVAQTNPFVTQGLNRFAANAGRAGQTYNQGADSVAFAAGSGAAPTVQARQFSGDEVSRYMNPFLSNVRDNTIRDLTQNFGIQNRDMQQRMAASKSFGNNRWGIAQGELARNQNDSFASALAGLNSEAYNNAAGLFQSDRNAELQAQQFNANMSQSRWQEAIRAAQIAAEMRNQGVAADNSEAQTLAQLGLQQQNVEQGNLDRQYEEFLRQYEDPFKRYQLLLSGLSGSPLSGNSTTKGRTFGMQASYGG